MSTANPAPASAFSDALILGIDTGGTYTDAVVYQPSTAALLATAKAPTTHADLSIGIEQAIDVALGTADVPATSIAMVSVSTTLATNALVEGKGRPAALIAIGFDAADLDRAGLQAALGSDPVVRIAGGHNSHGNEVAPLDTDALSEQVAAIADHVDAFAVASVFSVRNTAHELAARDLIRHITSKPVTCTHELSAQLNGPKRALTALLNARLIAPITELLATARGSLAARSIDAPLMVMRGDGSLVAANFMRDRPIETILSGPAASVVGAAHLLASQGHEFSDALVSDIGGTTTDIAIVRDGEAQFSAEGAVVGGHHTMVQAIRMHTHGLGGDSLIQVDDRATTPSLLLGPRRVVPLSQLAMHHRDAVEAMLRLQLDDYRVHARNLLMVLPSGLKPSVPLDPAEQQLLDHLPASPTAARTAITTNAEERLLRRLIDAGLVVESGFTPTDASQALGRQTTYDTSIAELAAELFARTKDRFGGAIAPDGSAAATMVTQTVSSTSANVVLQAAFDHDGFEQTVAASNLVQGALDTSEGPDRLTRINIDVAAPIVALGASAGLYYPAAAERLHTALIVPEHAEVANAIGAAVGQVRVRRHVTITAPRRGSYRVHLHPEPTTVHDLDEARAMAQTAVEDQLAEHMLRCGAAHFTTTVDWVEKVAEVEDRKMFVEGTLTLTAVGSPAALDSTKPTVNPGTTP